MENLEAIVVSVLNKIKPLRVVDLSCIRVEQESVACIQMLRTAKTPVVPMPALQIEFPAYRDYNLWKILYIQNARILCLNPG